jgi:hypothetical protein
MSSHYEATIRKPLVIGDKSYHDVTVDVAAPVEGKANKHWWIVFSIALIAFLWGLAVYLHCIYRDGTDLNKTVGWAWDITTLFGGLVLVMQEHFNSAVLYFSVNVGEWRLTVLQAIFLLFKLVYFQSFTWVVHG